MTPADVRALRKRMGLSRADLAALLRVDVSTVGRWETGTRTPCGKALLVLMRLQRQQEGAQ